MIVLILTLIFAVILLGFLALIGRDLVRRGRQRRQAKRMRPPGAPDPDARGASRSSRAKRNGETELQSPLDVIMAWSIRGGAIRGADAHNDGDLSAIVDRMLAPDETNDEPDVADEPGSVPASAVGAQPKPRWPRFLRSRGSGPP